MRSKFSVAVAAADGAIVAEEAACVESIMGAVMLHPEARAGLRNTTDPPLCRLPWPSIDPKHARTVVYLAAYVAAVDGEYDEAEVRLLRQMCEALDVKKKCPDAFAWVESAELDGIAARGNRLNAGFRHLGRVRSSLISPTEVFRTLELGGRHHGTSPKNRITGLPRSGNRPS